MGERRVGTICVMFRGCVCGWWMMDDGWLIEVFSSLMTNICKGVMDRLGGRTRDHYCCIHDLVYTNFVAADLIIQLSRVIHQVSHAFPLNLLDGKLDCTSSVVQFRCALIEGSRLVWGVFRK